MKKILLIFVLWYGLLCPMYAHAQGLGWQWVTESKCDAGNYNDEWGFAIDNKGNSFVATVAFYGVYSVFGADTLYNLGLNNETIISKLDTAGHFLWSKAFYNANSFPDDMAVDTAGNLYILDQYDPGSCTIGGITLTNTTSFEMYCFVKFDPNGNVLMAQNVAPGSTSLDNPAGINIDNAGNIYVTGLFDSVAHIGSTTLTSAGGLDVFVAKYNSSGTPVWAERFGGVSDEFVSKLRLTPNGNMYIQVNTYSSTITFGPDTFTLAGGVTEAFLVKLNNSGVPIWVKALAASSNLVYMTGCATDSVEQVYLTGGFTDNLLHFGPFLLHNYTTTGNGSAYVAKCDSSGNILWAIASGSNGNNETGWSIDVDPCGYIWVCGGINATLSEPMFIREYDQSGAVLNTLNLASGGDDECGIALDKKGNLYIGADYEYSPFFIGLDTFVQTGAENTFVAKYKYFKPGDTIRSETNTQSCILGPAVLTGPPGYDYYHWSNGTTGLYDTVYSSGTYLATCTITCNGTETLIDTFHVSYILPVDTVHASHDTTLCAGSSIVLQLPAGWTYYYWSNTAISRTTTIDSAGTYWGTSSSPCTTMPFRVDTFHVSYFVSSDTLYQSADTTVCDNSNVTLAAPQGFTNYYWNDGDTGSQHPNTPPGTWWVYCIPTCPDSITNIDTFAVVGPPANLPFSLGADTFVCDSIQLRVPGNGPSYLWQDGSSGISYTVSLPGVFYCTAYERGCSFSDTISVTIPMLTQHLHDTTVCASLLSELSINANVPPGAACLWNTGNTDTELFITTPGTYWVIVTDSVCIVSDTITVKTMTCDIVIHDVLTPNGDGINDTWVIENISAYPNSFVQLFDKWGDMVYEKTNYNNDFGGKGKNGELPDGTYYYLVKLNTANLQGEKNVWTGYLMVKR